ncbi:hypothetical protein BOTBODRAFT_184005 [Botryobasidium botryosum FD-172 SS1]|uniref:Beta-lactamase-related domain-containing protein n=1 Tax=Botryobasidium botryosum (strain FD-172 SS1) TaxID=930990 RepID=A0A067MZ64_BOTB1|nr:hypothetical protein BOTBODRAFT_184005 [Botryobasidium botryosum FD-172 SS1]
MDNYEKRVDQATSSDPREILGAISIVVGEEGKTLYHHASGFQSLASDAAPLGKDSAITLGSAGKFITHIAALQCVDKGLINLDEPVYAHLPELESLQIISKNEGPDASTKPFTLRFPTKKITLRHLLTHTSGIASPEATPELQAWKASKADEPEPGEDVRDPIVRMFSMPLLFEPGEGWEYGSSIHWTSLLIFRLTKQRMAVYVQENIFNPLGMTSSTYQPASNPEIRAHLLSMVRRDAEGLLFPVNQEPMDLACSITDLGKVLGDLIAPTSKILSKESVALIFSPAFPQGTPASTAIRGNTENYAAPAGIPPTMKEPPINYTVLAGLFVEDVLPLSGMPAGTVTWNGMPNVVWAVNRKKGLAALWGTQLLPVDDEKAVEVMMEFLKGAWAAEFALK